VTTTEDIVGAIVTLLGPDLTPGGVEWVWAIESHLDAADRILPAGPVTASLPFGVTIIADRIAPETVSGMVVRALGDDERPAAPAPEALRIVTRLFGSEVAAALVPGKRLPTEPRHVVAAADRLTHRRAGHLALACQRSAELDRPGSSASIWSAQIAADAFGLGAEFEPWARTHARSGAAALRLLPIPPGFSDAGPQDERWRPFRIAFDRLRGQVGALIGSADLGELSTVVSAAAGRIEIEDADVDRLFAELANSAGERWWQEAQLASSVRGRQDGSDQSGPSEETPGARWRPVAVAGLVADGVFVETLWRPDPGDAGPGAIRVQVEGRLSELAAGLPAAMLDRLYVQIVDMATLNVLDAVGGRLSRDGGRAGLRFSASPKIPRGWSTEDVMVALSLTDPLERRQLRRMRKQAAQRRLANVADEHRLPGASFGAAVTQSDTTSALFDESDTLAAEFVRRAPGQALEAEIVATGIRPDLPELVDGLLAVLDPALGDRAIDELIAQADTWRSCGRLAESVTIMCAVLDHERGIDRLCEGGESEPLVADLVWAAFQTADASILRRAAACYDRLFPRDSPDDEGEIDIN